MLPRQSIRRSMCVSVAALLLTGCGTTPSNVAMPYGTPPGGNIKQDPDRIRYKNKKDETIEPSPYVLPFEVTRGGVLAQMEAHIEVWGEQERVISHLNDNLGNGMFGGAIVSAGGALLSNLDITKIGAVIAGGGAVWGDHYKLTVQAENYRFGVQAMNCARVAVASIPANFWTTTYDESGQMKISRTALVTAADASSVANAGASVRDSLDILEGLFGTIHTTVQEIRRRLVSAQTSLKIAAANATDIQSALVSANQTQKVNETGSKNLQVVAAATNSTNQQIRTAAAALAGTSEQSMLRALNLPTELNTCTKQIGG